MLKLLVIHPHDGHFAGDTIEMSKEEFDAKRSEQAFPYYHVLTPEVIEEPAGEIVFVEGDLPMANHADMTGVEVAIKAEEALSKGKKKPKVAEE